MPAQDAVEFQHYSLVFWVNQLIWEYTKKPPNHSIWGFLIKFDNQTVELQGFEPWSRQGSRRAFYVRIYAWIFEMLQAHIRPLNHP